MPAASGLMHQSIPAVPGMESVGKCPTIARGGWALLELTDALRQTKGTVFSYTDRPRPVNNLFIFFCFSFQDDRRESICEQSTRIASHCHSLDLLTSRAQRARSAIVHHA